LGQDSKSHQFITTKKKKMKLFKVNKYLVMAALMLVTALLFVLGKGHEAHGAHCNAAVITLTDEEKKDMSDSEQKVLLAMKKMVGQVKEGIPTGTITKEEAQALIDQIKKDVDKMAKTEDVESIKTSLTNLESILKTQGTVLAEMKINTPSKGQGLLEVIKENSEQLKASAKKGKEHEFFIKADTLATSVTGNQSALQLPDIGQLATRKLTVYDIFRKVPVPQNSNGVVRYVDWDAASISRAAKALSEGDTYDASTAKWATYTLTLEKVGDMIPLSEEFMYDNAMFAAELENFLRVNVAIKVDTDLVSGNGTTPNIKGINAQIPAYAAAASGITDASIYDLIVKLREAITASYGSKYNPNVALMNITDINKMKLKKDAQHNYILPPFFDKNGNIVDGITVVECNAFTANTMAVGDSRYGAIYEEPGVTVQTGYATGDFESDMMTIKARRRLNLLIRTADQTGWLKVTDIAAAVTTLAS
jgi:hypothetical protein